MSLIASPGNVCHLWAYFYYLALFVLHFGASFRIQRFGDEDLLRVEAPRQGSRSAPTEKAPPHPTLQQTSCRSGRE